MIQKIIHAPHTSAHSTFKEKLLKITAVTAQHAPINEHHTHINQIPQKIEQYV
jgi:hypothetical protein